MRSGRTGTITIVVKPTASGIITDTATATTTTSETTLTNNTATTTTTVNPSADMALTKTAAPNPVYVGNPLTYTLTITNNGFMTATGVRVTDTLPANVMFGSGSPGYTRAGSGVTWMVGTLAVGASQPLTLTVTPNVTATGTLNNSAVVGSSLADYVPGNNTAAASTTVLPKADLSIGQAASPIPVWLGNPLTYTVVITNSGPSIATGVRLTDTLPSGAAFVSASAGCSSAGSVVTCTLGTLVSGATATATIVMAPGATGTATNVVTTASDAFDPNTANNTNSSGVTVIPAADLRLVKTARPAIVLTGEPITYTLTLTNAGPSTATSVRLTDTLPANVNFGSVSTSQGSCGGSSLVICSLGTLNSGTTATVMIVVTSTTEGALVNAATATSTVSDPAPANNLATVTTGVNPVDLAVSKTDWPDPITPGNRLTYTVVVTNTGPLAGTNVQLVDYLPASVTFNAASITRGACSGTGPITCAIGTLNVGAVVTATVVVTPTATGMLVNTAVVSATEPDPDPADNTATASTAVNPTDLALTKTGAPNPVYAGNALTYTLVITNNGPINASGVMVTDTLPANVTFKSASAGCAPSGGAVVCSVGALNNGASQTLTFSTGISLSAR